MSFGIYLTGFVVVIVGLAYGASLMHVPIHWIVVGALVLVGVGGFGRETGLLVHTLNRNGALIGENRTVGAFSLVGTGAVGHDVPPRDMGWRTYSALAGVRFP